MSLALIEQDALDQYRDLPGGYASRDVWRKILYCTTRDFMGLPLYMTRFWFHSDRTEVQLRQTWFWFLRLRLTCRAFRAIIDQRPYMWYMIGRYYRYKMLLRMKPMDRIWLTFHRYDLPRWNETRETDCLWKPCAKLPPPGSDVRYEGCMAMIHAVRQAYADYVLEKMEGLVSNAVKRCRAEAKHIQYHQSFEASAQLCVERFKKQMLSAPRQQSSARKRQKTQKDSK